MKVAGNVSAALVALLALALAVGATMLVGDDPDAPEAEPVRVAGATAAAEVSAEDAKAAARQARLEEPVGHHGEYAVQYDDLPAATQQQLDVAQAIIEKYPTVADATADGWTAATINLRGIAAHFLRGGLRSLAGGLDDTFDLNEPEALLYDGIEPEAPIIGVSYLVAGETAPEGFEGKWDVWHRHDAVCFADGLVIAEVGGHRDSKIDIAQEECDAQSGITAPISYLSMIHVWMKADNPSTAGVFSHDHPALD
ncbi:MAG: hypothetical protein ACT4OX_02665 [Actinomycetota bacterium]